MTTIMYVCDICHDSSPENCGHTDPADLRVLEDGTTVCETCHTYSDDWAEGPLPAWGDLPQPVAHIEPASPAIVRLNDERRRQIAEEGWTAAHDDRHVDGELARAGACYALFGGLPTRLDGHASGRIVRGATGATYGIRDLWPWDDAWWKPKGRHRDLVCAGALIAADLDRLLRTAESGTAGPMDELYQARLCELAIEAYQYGLANAPEIAGWTPEKVARDMAYCDAVIADYITDDVVGEQALRIVADAVRAYRAEHQAGEG